MGKSVTIPPLLIRAPMRRTCFRPLDVSYYTECSLNLSDFDIANSNLLYYELGNRIVFVDFKVEVAGVYKSNLYFTCEITIYSTFDCVDILDY